MLVNFAFIIGGLVLLVVGSEGLVRGASGLALRLEIAPLAVGLTVVAFATGSPELFVSVKAALTGNSGIALGSVVGSNIINICLGLGLAAVIRPMRVRARLVRREMPLMIAATVLLCVLLLDGALGRVDGLILVTGAFAYTLYAYKGAMLGDTAEVSAQFEGPQVGVENRWRDVAFAAVGLVALVIGAELLVEGAVTVAGIIGISQVVVALTIVALGTSLPELATSVTAARRRQADVAFGNVIGSNTLNIFGTLGIVALIHPFAVQGLRTLDFAMFVGTAVLLLVLMIRRWVLNRWEGLVLIVLYGAYIFSLVR
jgi:cation:H+ antiporter